MFTAVLGHDLRNPLSAILTAAQLLDASLDDEAVQQDGRADAVERASA